MTTRATPKRDDREALRRARRRIGELESRIQLLEGRAEVLRAAGIGTWDLDLARKELSWDPAPADGGGSDELSRASLASRFRHVRPEDWQALGRAARRAVRRGGLFETEIGVCEGRRTRILQCHGRVISDPQGRPARVTGVYWDVTAEREAQRRRHELPSCDPLTGLADRHSFVETLERALLRARRDGSGVAVLVLDLDHFEQVNDALGHGAGDRLLRAAAERLTAHIRAGDPAGRLSHPDDALSRLGGDEFGLLLCGLGAPKAAAAVARRLLAVLAEPFSLGDQEVYLGASIGIALFPGDGADATSLLRNADTAVRAAKAEGRNEYRYFARSMNALMRQRFQVENALRRALREHALLVEYQPIVDAKTRRILGAEALARLRNGTGSWIPPDEFIPIAEATGLIVPLGEWVLRRACREARPWLEGGGLTRISVNVSNVQIARPGFPERLRQVLRATGVAPEHLVLEITETAVLRERGPAPEVLQAVQNLGVTIALDDFGTGYSSLAWLRRVPIGCLKIDKSFVHEIVTCPGDARLTGGIVRLARELGLWVVAEGVETSRQAEALTALGCNALQGFLFARPMDAGQLAALLAAGGGPLPREAG